MKTSNINREDLVFTKKGTKVLLKEGDLVDKLTVIEYVGKKWVKSRSVFEAVYEVLCECGNTELRRHAYLVTVANINGKCCYECAKANSGKHLKPRGRSKTPKNNKKKHSEEVYKTDDFYQKKINEIFEMPLKEVMSRYEKDQFETKRQQW